MIILRRTRRGKYAKKLLVLKHKPFQVFWEDYYIKKIKEYRMHLWKMIILGKQFVGDIRDGVLNKGDCSFGHNFTEYLNLKYCSQQ